MIWRDQQGAWRAMVAELRPNMAMTLSAAKGMNPITFEGKVAHFLNALQREAYGRNWSRRPSADRFTTIGFTEHHKTNLHMHLAADVPTRQLRLITLNAHETWASICHAGTYYAEYLEQDPARYASYITKRFYDSATSDMPFVYTPRKSLAEIRTMR